MNCVPAFQQPNSNTLTYTGIMVKKERERERREKKRKEEKERKRNSLMHLFEPLMIKVPESCLFFCILGLQSVPKNHRPPKQVAE